MDRWTNVGSAGLLVIEDGLATYEIGFAIVHFDGVPNEQLPDEIRSGFAEDGLIYLPYNPTLIRTDTTTVLVDFGAGHEAAVEWEEDVGHAAGSLRAAGVSPDQVEIAVITHAHADHLGGLVVPGEGGARAPRFPGARHLLARAEWRYWVEEEPAGVSVEMIPDARRDLHALREAGVLELVDGDEEIADGVRLLPTPGHTPGHLSVLVGSGPETAVVNGDVLLTPWAFAHPEWDSRADVDPELAVRTRRALFDRLVESGGLLFAYHLETPGRVRPAGDAYAFDPA